MIRYLDNNCLVQSQIPSYNSSNVKIYTGTNQDNCENGTCRIDLRQSGCYLCSGDGDGDNCTTCLKGYMLFKGMCVNCSSDEDCPFNNSRNAECTDEDISQCNFMTLRCNKHQCEPVSVFLIVGAFVILVGLIVGIVFIVGTVMKNISHSGYDKLSQYILFNVHYEELCEPRETYYNVYDNDDSMTIGYSW